MLEKLRKTKRKKTSCNFLTNIRERNFRKSRIKVMARLFNHKEKTTDNYLGVFLNRYYNSQDIYHNEELRKLEADHIRGLIEDKGNAN